MRKKMSEGKKALVAGLMEEYDIKTAADIQEALKDLLGSTLEGMLEAEMNEHLGYEKYGRDAQDTNRRNGVKTKKVRSSQGEFGIEVPQDRDSSFEPKAVAKRSKDISAIEHKIIAMYARGASVRQISEQIEEIYGFEVSDGFVSDVTDKVLPMIEEWQSRPLESVYPILYIDAIVFHVRENGSVVKKSCYIVMGIDTSGRKEVLSISLGEAESAKYWLGIFNSMKNRGVEDVLVCCADGLSGIREAIEAAFPKADYQRCIVHMVRNTLKRAASKDMKSFASDLKSIYHAADEEAALHAVQAAEEKWNGRYAGALDRWRNDWTDVCTIFKYSQTVRKVIYTTNAIESLNSAIRRLTRQRSVHPTGKAVVKSVWLAVREHTKKWTMPVRNWAAVYSELKVMNPERLE